MLLRFLGETGFSVDLSLAFTALLAFLILLYTLLGALRGGERAGLRLGLTAFSAGLAYLYVLLPGRATFLPALLRLTERLAPGSIPDDLPTDLLALAHSAVWALAAPALFLALFLVFNLILYLLYLLLAALLFPSRRYRGDGRQGGKGRARFAGALLGALTGLLVFLALNLSYYGYGRAAAANAALIGELSEDRVEIREREGLDHMIARACGSGAVFDSLTSFRVDGVKIWMSRELEKAGKIGTAALLFLGEPGEGADADAALSVLSDELEDSTLLFCVVTRGAGYLESLIDSPAFWSDLTVPEVSPAGLRGAHRFLGELKTAEPSDFSEGLVLFLRFLRYFSAENPSAADAAALSGSLSDARLLRLAIVAAANIGEELSDRGELLPLLFPDGTAGFPVLSELLPELCRILGEEQNVTELLSSFDLIPELHCFGKERSEWGEAQLSAVRLLGRRMESSAALRRLAGAAVVSAGGLLGDAGDGGFYASQVRDLAADAANAVSSALSGKGEAERRLACQAAVTLGELFVEMGAEGYLDSSAALPLHRNERFVTRVAELILSNELLHPVLIATVNATVDHLAPRYNLPADRIAQSYIEEKDLVALTGERIGEEAALLCALFTSDPAVTADPLDTIDALKNSILFSRFFDEVFAHSAEQYLEGIRNGSISIHSLPEEIKRGLLAP